MTTTKPAPRKPTKAKTRSQLPFILGSITISEAVKLFRTLDRTYELVMSTHRATLSSHLAQIQTAADRLGHTTLDHLVGDGAAFLTAATGVHNPTAFLNTADAETVHPIRNLILTLCLASAADLKQPPREVYNAITVLKARTAHTKRPLCDDEILLARTASIVELRTNTDRRRPVSYALNDAGYAPVETTKTTLADFEGEEIPTDVLAAGHNQIESRYLSLDPYARRLIAVYFRALPEDHPTDKPLLFHPRPGPKKTKNPEGSASATSTITMTKFLTDLGIKHSDVTASSIRYWRMAHTYLTRGAEEALDVAGMPANTIGTGKDKRSDLTRLLRVIGPALPQQVPTPKPKLVVDFTNPTWD